MKVTTFIADSAADAVAQIRAPLGPEALVLSVRPLPCQGLSRLWQKPRLEVLATLPEPLSQSGNALDQLRQEIAELKQQIPLVREASFSTTDPEASDARTSPTVQSRWRVGSVLEQMGIVPLHNQKVVDLLHTRHGEQPPDSLGKQLGLMRAILSDLWKPPLKQESASSLHVFVGPPGVGKTALLCKWLTQTVLVAGRSARVWRLDGQAANTAESLWGYGEILAVPVERSWSRAEDFSGADIGFVDLPGADWTDVSAMNDLKEQLGLLPGAQVHLVLNAAYEAPLLFAQIRGFAPLSVVDLSFTHLDEETKWGKLWNFVLGTNYSIRFLSAGQNIPGNLQEASPEALFLRQIPCR
jgi:flagellar biosynthesis protein FlhF